MTMVIKAGIAFAYIGGAFFFLLGVYLSYRRGRVHPLLLLCISAISISWIEAPYDWAVYAQFPPEIPRMPSWWPMDMTWGGLPLSVPPGYIAYFVLPAVIAVSVGRWLIAAHGWRAPQTLLATGFVAGGVGAVIFNAGLGEQMGVFYYGRVIGGLAILEGTKHQYPLYDTLAMGIQMLLFSYLLGRTDSQERSVIEIWADSRATTRLGSSMLSIEIGRASCRERVCQYV